MGHGADRDGILDAEKETNLPLSEVPLGNVTSTNPNNPLSSQVRTVAALNVANSTSSARRVLILSDSHGRNLATELNSVLKGFNYAVTNVCKPGATLEHVVRDIDLHTVGFSFNDCVVIIGGSNNSYNGKVSLAVLKQIVFSAKHTNVLVSAAPYQYSKRNKNDFLFRLNKLFYEAVANFCKTQRSKSVSFVDINTVLVKEDYVKSGEHLNINGKRKLCNIISNVILESTKSNHNKQVLYSIPLSNHVDGVNATNLDREVVSECTDFSNPIDSYATDEEVYGDGLSTSDNFLATPFLSVLTV